MAVASLSKDTFQQSVLSQKGIVFVDFYADWCGPCKMTAPIIEQLAEEHKDMMFYKVNVDENAEVVSQYSIFSIPTFIIFKDGKVTSQFSGGMGKESFENEIKKVSIT
ncbi:MAG: thioredoxin [Patescibacteria group bacterium]